MNIENHSDDYLQLYADCIPVKGASRSAIYDLTRNEVILFPSEYFQVLKYLSEQKLGSLLSNIVSAEEKRLITTFIDFLHENELVQFVRDLSEFPRIEERWEMPAIVENAIIDVHEKMHDVEKIFSELDELGCRFVQLRSFSDLPGPHKLNEILISAQNKSIESLELILKYDGNIPDLVYKKLLEDHPMVISLTLHTAPVDRILEVDYGLDKDLASLIAKNIYFTTQSVSSQTHCGLITLKHLNTPSVSGFFETKLHNGCLNGKISIDAAGEIKNCPSMVKSYGNISETSLITAIDKKGFKDLWRVVKDQIEICKDCELRYICSDCRAYVEKPENILSKPLKCGYDPYTAEWEDWTQNPLKKEAIQFYGLQDCLPQNDN